MPLFKLAHELIERILASLDTYSLLSCRLVNTKLNNIIQSSPILQYLQACQIAGLVDNPHCTELSYAEKLRVLTEREEAWNSMRPVFKKTVKVDFPPSKLYKNTNGILLVGEANQKSWNYLNLHSSPDDDPRWIRIPGHGPKIEWTGHIIASGLAINEHDLIVNIISSSDDGQTDSNVTLDLVFLQFSTGQYHPLARQPVIHLNTSPSAFPFIAVEICGDNMALIVSSTRRVVQDPDELLILDWKSGTTRLHHEAPPTSYTSLQFNSHEILLVPSIFPPQFEIWRIPSSDLLSNTPYRLLSLMLPPISRSCRPSSIVSRGELTPFARSTPNKPSRPFYCAPEDSIIISTLSLRGCGNPSFTHIVHRRDLLDVIDRWQAQSAVPEDAENIVDESADATSSHTRSPSPSDSSASSSSSCSSSSAVSSTYYGINQVPWADWGPPISRWFFDDDWNQWITASAGPRCAFLGSGAKQTKVAVGVFNPPLFRKAYNQFETRMADMFRLYAPKGEVYHGCGKADLVWVFNDNGRVDGVEVGWLNHHGAFARKVPMGLKCAMHFVPWAYGLKFDDLLIDEERLVGLNTNDEELVESVTVLYYG